MSNSIYNGTFVLGSTSATTLSAGPGIKIDSTSVPGTIKISNDETVLWSGTKGAVNDTISLSEAYTNFEKIAFYTKGVYTDTPLIYTFAVVSGISDFRFMNVSFDGGNTLEWVCRLEINSTTGLTVARSQILTQAYAGNTRSTAAAATTGGLAIAIQKIVGINRISGGN